MTKDWLVEQVKTMRNLCDTAIFLKENGKDNLLPTILELMLEECQSIVDEQCVVEDDGQG